MAGDNPAMEHIRRSGMNQAIPGKWIQTAAAFGAVAPMALLASWMYAVRDSAPGVAEFFLGPVLFGGGMIFWLLFLHLVLCGDRLQSLGLRVAGFGRDVFVGVLIGFGFLLLKHATDPLLAGLFAPRPPSEEIMTLLIAVARDPVLLALWLGPVVWIGVAAFEELWRVVVLRRLWLIFSSPAGQWAALVLVSVLVGAAHAYQGPASIISIAMKSVLMGAYFKFSGRVRPLIVAHAVYDSVQIVMAVIAIREGGLS